MTDNKRVVVLGAGISGLSFAWRMHELGFQTEICEAQDHIGGLAGTLRPDEGKYHLDFGPHFFITHSMLPSIALVRSMFWRHCAVFSL